MDGFGHHGMYTEALLPQLERKDQSASQAFAHTHRDVLEKVKNYCFQDRSARSRVNVNLVRAAQVWSTGFVGLSRNAAMIESAHLDLPRTEWPVKGNATS